MLKVFLFCVLFVLVHGQSFLEINPGNYSLLQSATTSTLSFAGQWMNAVTVGNRTFFTGGWNGASTTTGIIDMYDSTNNTFRLNIAKLKFPTMKMIAVASGTKIYFFDGAYPNTVLEIFDTVTFNITKSTATVPVYRNWSGAVAIGDLIIVSGSGGLGLAPTYVIYNITSGVFSTVAAPSLANRYAIAAATNGSIAFFCGGISYNTAAAFKEVDIFNYNTKSWTNSSLAVPRQYPMATIISDVVYIVGNGPTTYSFGEIYELSSSAWSTLTYPSGAVIDYSVSIGCLLILSSQVYSVNVYTYNTETKVWRSYDAAFGNYHTLVTNGRILMSSGGQSYKKVNYMSFCDTASHLTRGLCNIPYFEPCTFGNDAGKLFDFNALSNTTMSLETVQDAYYLTMCKTAVQYEKLVNQNYQISYDWSNAVYTSISNGISIRVETGELCQKEPTVWMKRVAVINMNCAAGNSSISLVVENPLCTYTFQVNTPLAC